MNLNVASPYGLRKLRRNPSQWFISSPFLVNNAEGDAGEAFL